MGITVLVFSSLSLDLVVFANKLSTMGVIVTGEKFILFPSGKGLNQVIAAKRQVLSLV